MPKAAVDELIQGLHEDESGIQEDPEMYSLVQKEKEKTPAEEAAIEAALSAVRDYFLTTFDVDISASLLSTGQVHIFDNNEVFQGIIIGASSGYDFSTEEKIEVLGFAYQGSIIVKELATLDETIAIIQHEKLHTISHEKIRFERDSESEAEDTLFSDYVRSGIKVDRTRAFHNLNEYVIEKTNTIIQRSIWQTKPALHTLTMDDKVPFYKNNLNFGDQLVTKIATATEATEAQIFEQLQRAVFFGDISILRKMSEVLSKEEFREITHIQGKGMKAFGGSAANEPSG